MRIENKNQYEITKEIKEQIHEKGFYVHENIDKNEIVTKIRISFLQTIKIIGVPLFIFIVFLGFMGEVTGIIIGFSITIIIFLICLLFISIYYALIGGKISHIVLTENHFSIGDNIYEYQNRNEIYFDYKTKEILNSFFEVPFIDNFLKEKEKEEREKMIGIFFSGSELILDLTNNLLKNKEGFGIGLAIYLGYLIFCIVIFLMYILGSTILFFVGVFINFCIKRYMIHKGNKVVQIQEKFKEIENNSKEIFDTKEKLMNNLEDAFNQDWKDGLLMRLDSGFEKISGKVSLSIDISKELVEIIEKSIYVEMFNKNKYDSWLKKQTRDPIDGLLTILLNELKIVDNKIEEIKDSKVEQIILSRKRIEMKKNELVIYIGMLTELRNKIS